jgi:transposase InsO family protein
LAVAQIDHAPMDVIVVDEEHRQPIQRPSLTVVIDVYSRMVLGFSVYLEKPSAFTVGMAIAHAILPKENWLAGVGVSSRVALLGKDAHNPLRQREGISRHRNWSCVPKVLRYCVVKVFTSLVTPSLLPLESIDSTV